MTLATVRSLMAHKVEVEHFLHEMLIMLLVKNKWFTQLQMLLQYHVVDDSAPVAFQLLSISSEDYPAAEQLALDMLQRLRKYEAMVDILVARGELLAALRLINDTRQSFKVDPKRFLDAAMDKEDRIFFTVFRFFEGRGYKLSSEYVQKFSKVSAIRAH